MVFYETSLCFHNRCPPSQLKTALKRAAQIISSHHGHIISVQDLGWRNTAYPCSKPRVGIFHKGRWFSLIYGTSPKALDPLKDMLNHDNGLLRHLTCKKRDWKVERERTNWYPADPVGERDHGK